MSRSVVFVFVLVLAALSTVYSKKAKPCEKPLGRRGWGGTCFGTQYTLENDGLDSCESIKYNSTINGCYDNEACCVECSKMSGLCDNRYRGSFGSNAHCGYCPLALRLNNIPRIKPGSGCYCCKECRPKRKCQPPKGHCITKHDPVYNPEWCINVMHGTIIDRLCKGWGCHCCLFP